MLARVTDLYGLTVAVERVFSSGTFTILELMSLIVHGELIPLAHVLLDVKVVNNRRLRTELHAIGDILSKLQDVLGHIVVPSGQDIEALRGYSCDA